MQDKIWNAKPGFKASFTNPSFIFDVDVSSFLNKAFHCVVTAFASCNMQGSFLIGERKVVALTAIVILTLT